MFDRISFGKHPLVKQHWRRRNWVLLRKRTIDHETSCFLESLGAIDIFKDEKPEASYRLTHDATEDPDKIFCPYVGSQGDCAIRIDYDPSEQEPIEIIAFILLVLDHNLIECVGRVPKDDGGIVLLDEALTWVWIGHVGYANSPAVQSKISQQKGDLFDLSPSTS